MDPARALGEQGLSEAIDRLRSRLIAGGEWYQVPFTEAMFWITALKDIHKNRIDYTTTEGKTLKALGWARNYAAHELLTLSIVNLASSGLQGAGLQGMAVQGGPASVVWVEDAALRPRDDEHGRRVLYQTLVAGRSALEPLKTAESYLRSLR